MRMQWMPYQEGYSMRITCDGSGLRCRTGVSRLHVIGGLLVLLMVAVAGCGDAEPDVTVELGIATVAPLSTSAPAQTALPGDATWVLDSLDGRPIIENSFVTLKIDEDLLVGYDGCNSYGGRFEDGRPIADAGGMFSGPPMARTQRDCAEPEGVTGTSGRIRVGSHAGREVPRCGRPVGDL